MMQSQPQSPEPDEALDRPARRILVVEDEVLVRLYVSEALRDAGHVVIEAMNGDEALGILEAGARVDLVFSDVRMPGKLDGLGLLEQITARFPAIPVIITSGHLLSHFAIDGGASDFLAKPYQLDKLLAIIDARIGTAP